jgi:hypothetical protein
MVGQSSEEKEVSSEHEHKSSQPATVSRTAGIELAHLASLVTTIASLLWAVIQETGKGQAVGFERTYQKLFVYLLTLLCLQSRSRHSECELKLGKVASPSMQTPPCTSFVSTCLCLICIAGKRKKKSPLKDILLVF